MKLRLIAAGGICGLVAVVTGCSVAADQSSVGPPVSSTPRAPDGSGPADPALVTAAGLWPCPDNDSAAPAVADGLPAVTLPCLAAGPEVDLSELRGLPTVVNVWASWCAPCRQELPFFGEVARANVGSVRFLGINYADTRDAALTLAADTEMTFPSVVATEEQIRSSLRIVGLPVTLFVDAQGRVVGRTNLISDRAQLIDLIDEHLGIEAQ